ncbi:hypothetical protein CLV25_11475 [Acetobacteroides hydrogenigenes]|uniref:Uncharacterized protein n=1 Tax=Acetobacteroides hydrogenigenes TaxID=979970 RepID=A0A4V2RNI9_9BACT|nr:hypothetical protein CLV25_11475 [Acetobacteroides hydrogenigenes]
MTNGLFLIRNEAFLMRNGLFLMRNEAFLGGNGPFLIGNELFLGRNEPFHISISLKKAFPIKLKNNAQSSSIENMRHGRIISPYPML